jgi:hypothetical protein
MKIFIFCSIFFNLLPFTQAAELPYMNCSFTRETKGGGQGFFYKPNSKTLVNFKTLNLILVVDASMDGRRMLNLKWEFFPYNDKAGAYLPGGSPRIFNSAPYSWSFDGSSSTDRYPISNERLFINGNCSF